ncbi:alcohol dehydrogenase cytochrome c protein [Halorhabdus tiamatea SARL4B]|uniref:Alcohol dehydrogenase cytochrome c protein n=2 Tax=Halorhabdus tiamatea SARL4B TaxID=1033806 RepID=U2DI47_9EURY|nr:PQQ-binding-like beta-propeller repeat protein [Halorhabdus tiamatea]ERJ05627.1 alcohol dehydrogenase cytochrome c protein [Halorhabdus tiamatea SARL4B]
MTSVDSHREDQPIETATLSRRHLLEAGGTAVAAGLAGCTLPGGGSADGDTATLPSCPIDVEESPETYRTHPNDDVRMWRGGLRRLGYYPEETVPESVSVNWSFPINYVGHTAAKSSPVPTPDREQILFAGDTGRVESYAPSGRNDWSTQTNATEKGFHGSAAIVDGVAYIGGYNGDLYAIGVESGEMVWHTTSEDLAGALAIGSSPAYYEGVLYVVAEYWDPSSGALWAIDAETGEPIHVDDRMWGQPHPSATIDLEEERLIAGSNDGAVYCWQFPCLEFEWKFQTGPEGGPDGKTKADGEFNHGAQVKGTAPTFDGRVFVGSWDDHVYCLDVEDGEELWSFETGAIVMSNPAADPNEGVVYVGSSDHYVYALDAETGEEQWSTNVGGRVIGSLTVTDDTVLVGSSGSYVYALEKHTGDPRWRVENRGHVTSAPVPLDGRVYYAERAVVDGYYDDGEFDLVEPGHAYCLVED